MKKRVQALIFNGNRLLTIEGINENGRRDCFFPSGELQAGETADEAIKRLLKQQLNIEAEITLSFSRESYGGIKTFLFDMTNAEIALEVDLSGVKLLNSYYNASAIGWSPIETGTFRESEAQALKQLLEEAYLSGYEAPWLKDLRRTYYDSKMGRMYLENIYKKLDRYKADASAGMGIKLKAILIVLGLGLLFNYFFIFKSIGVSGVIYTIAIAASGSYLIKDKMRGNKRLGYIFLIAALLLAISYGIYNNYALRALNVIAIPLLLTAYFLVIRYEGAEMLNIAFISGALKQVSTKSFIGAPRLFRFGKELISEKSKLKKDSNANKILLGLLISIPLLIIVLMLLSEADMMFNYYLKNLGHIFGEVTLGELVGRSIIISLVSIYMFGFLWSLNYNDFNAEGFSMKREAWEPVTIITLITVINIAYLIFTIIQLSYLYGGGINPLPEGFTYAEYARRGFFELILVTLINLMVLVFSIYFTKKGNKALNKLMIGSYSILIIFTFNMLVSAAYKMKLYESAYGYTQQRIFVQAFMLLIGVVLAIVLAGIWHKRVPIFKCVVIATVIVYVGLNFINVDRLIAMGNIQRYHETKKLDINYLRSLSYDAAPEIFKLLEKEPLEFKDELEMHLSLRGDIASRKHKWYQYNYHRVQMQLNSQP